MTDETHSVVESDDEQHPDGSEQSVSALPISRRSALGGLLGLGLLSGSAAAQPPAVPWNRDRDADGYRLLDLGALTMRNNETEIRDFEGDNLEIDDGVLNAVVPEEVEAFWEPTNGLLTPTTGYDGIDVAIAEIGALVMQDNPTEIRDFEGDNLEIDDGVLNAIVDLEDFDLTAGRYLDFDDDTLNFTGPAEWENETTTSVNEASGQNATVGGGSGNVASGENATVGGGGGEEAENGNIAGGANSTVGGGQSNTASVFWATVGGGSSNAASGVATTVGGGFSNEASGSVATVGGGFSNEASGFRATIPGGQDNTAAGPFSFAAGRAAKANHDGAFVFGDSSFATISSNGPDEARFQMPVHAPSFENNSTRTAKTNIEPVDQQQALAGVESLDVSTWEFIDGDDGRHMGPMAEDFFETFGLGNTDNSIATVDADGVAFAAIQGLSAKLEQENAELRERLATLEEHVGMTPVAADGGTAANKD